MNEKHIESLIQSLDTVPPCTICKTRLRFGDHECPRCGNDIEDNLRIWAKQILDELSLK